MIINVRYLISVQTKSLFSNLFVTFTTNLPPGINLREAINKRMQTSGICPKVHWSFFLLPSIRTYIFGVQHLTYDSFIVPNLRSIILYNLEFPLTPSFFLSLLGLTFKRVPRNTGYFQKYSVSVL